MSEILSDEWQCNVASAIAHQASMLAETITAALTLPSAVYRPKLSIDGNQWCALYGSNLQEGVVGFGESPAAAMRDFDKSWFTQLTKATP